MHAPRFALVLPLFFASFGCAAIAGTDDYVPCETETCDGAGAGSSTASTASGSTCFDVTMNVAGSVKVKQQGAGAEFDPETPGPVCIQGGSVTFFAECDDGGGSDPPVAVAWGNGACVDDTTSCALDLAKDETFTVVAASCP